ncbi:hypothetical protein IGI39_004799 [Enterococcus sp. AZ135]|uniref:hypothetical protein n=1 Tax=unclassified Enterococcus TaxID=2608891 RepID=UPI003F219EB5
MSILSKDQIKEMIQRYDIKTTEDIKNAFKDMFGEAVQEIMEAELNTHSIENKGTIGCRIEVETVFERG